MHSRLAHFSLRIFTLFAMPLTGVVALAPALHAEEQLYTCGMHPQVIRKAPGDCPICGMDLTPVRANTAVPAVPAPALHEKEQLYTCGMHPQVIRKAPGDCPICGMKLTPVRANAAVPAGERKIKYYKSTMMPEQMSDKPTKDTMGMDMVPVYEGEEPTSSAVNIDPVMIQRMNLKTELVTRGPVSRSIRALGVVAYNEDGLRDISLKYEAWIEKLHVTATGTTVKAGDPLFDLYAPELYAAQLNHLVALRAEGAAGGPLTHASLERMKLFDVSPGFIADLVKSGRASRTYTYRSPVSGVVTEKMVVEGQMMKSGERLYRLADLSSVWVQTQVYEKDFAAVTAGRSAEVRTTYAPERTFTGRVAQVLPIIDGMTRTATARLVIANPDGVLRPGMFAEVRLNTATAGDAVLVPDSAVLRSGDRNTVFVARPGGVFEPREVTLGERTDDHRYAVLKGLAVGDRVVVSGQFMLDSESRLREAILKMTREEKPAEAKAEADAEKPERK